MDGTFFLLGAVFAFLGVAAGAFGAHVLQDRLTPDRFNIFEVAVRYQMYHALGLLAVGFALTRFAPGPTTLAGWLFTAGILIFSGTLYAMAFGAPRVLGAITPVGGLAFLAGWVALAIAVVRSP